MRRIEDMKIRVIISKIVNIYQCISYWLRKSFMLQHADIEVDEETHIVIHKCKTKKKENISNTPKAYLLFCL